MWFYINGIFFPIRRKSVYEQGKKEEYFLRKKIPTINFGVLDRFPMIVDYTAF